MGNGQNARQTSHKPRRTVPSSRLAKSDKNDNFLLTCVGSEKEDNELETNSNEEHQEPFVVV